MARGYIRPSGKKKGTWEITLELGLDAEGRRRRTTRAFAGTKREAEGEQARLLAEFSNKTYVKPAKETVATYLTRWLEDVVEPNVAPRTFQRYSEIVHHHLIPALGTVKLADLGTAHIARAERQWRQGGRRRGEGGFSPRTILHYHRVLHTALSHAVRSKVLAVNPISKEHMDTPRVESPEMQVLTLEQSMALLAALRGTTYEVPIALAASTGMRLGEVLGLRWRDLNLTTGSLRVAQTFQPERRDGERFGQPKTKGSRRTIDLHPEMIDLLRQHRAQQPVVSLPGAGHPDLVFTIETGEPIPPGRMRDAFYGVLASAGLPRVRLHDLRHGAATLLLAEGTPVKAVSEILGHSNAHTTLVTYGHAVAGMSREAIHRLGGALWGSSAAPEASRGL